MKYKMSEFDYVFLSFNEPNAELLYAKLSDLVPWTKRVHGVKGFDAAHRACADVSDTHFFVTVDGDNEIYEDFLDLEIDISEEQNNHAWTWAGRNHVNGLVYGNGGLKLWSKTFVYEMKSHELADDPARAVDFCWSFGYNEMYGCYSTSMINGSPEQAWRSGFREGVKMCLDQGRRVSPIEFHRKIWHGNINRLCIWSSIGQDVEYGVWAMYGARMGANLAMLTDNDYTVISNYDSMSSIWNSVKNDNPVDGCTILGDKLRIGVGLDISVLSPDDSRFFKRIYMNTPRQLLSQEQIKHLMATRYV